MKILLTLILFFFSFALKAQNGIYDVKVYTTDYHVVKGLLKVANKEGIAVDGYDNKYHILHIADIQKIKVRRRGLKIGEGAGKGALAGLGLGAGISALIQNEVDIVALVLLTGTLATTGAVVGTASGAVAEQFNRKLVLNIKGNQSRFNESYELLLPYVNTTEVYSKAD